MDRPLIGVAAFRGARSDLPVPYPYQAGGQAYLEALTAAGALPIVLPLLDPEVGVDGFLERIDGLLLAGGGDLDPRTYGATEVHPKVDRIDPLRDRVELHLARRAAEAGIPLLAICRGIQVVNVALGGTLWQDLEDERPGSLDHRASWRAGRWDHLAHPLKVEPRSRLADLLGAEALAVNSLHHQGIRALAPALRPVAWAPDGLIEGVELPDHPFYVGVQGHPEHLWREHRPWARLFQGFVAASRRR